MSRSKYTAEFKTKIILAVLQGDRELNEICSEYSLHPNMVRKWKQEFLKMLILPFLQNPTARKLKERRIP